MNPFAWVQVALNAGKLVADAVKDGIDARQQKRAIKRIQKRGDELRKVNEAARKKAQEKP